MAWKEAVAVAAVLRRGAHGSLISQCYSVRGQEFLGTLLVSRAKLSRELLTNRQYFASEWGLSASEHPFCA
jgi:hypothetical protein